MATPGTARRPRTNGEATWTTSGPNSAITSCRRRVGSRTLAAGEARLAESGAGPVPFGSERYVERGGQPVVALAGEVAVQRADPERKVTRAGGIVLDQ